MTAKIIRDALATKHSSDIFVPECKTGQTWFNDKLRKLDAWVLRRSWVHFGTIGYEIKISRSDFLRDKKWPEYLDYCHEFYFVCPWGMIQKNDIPDNRVGLCWITKNGSRVIIKRHADYREIGVPKLLLYYVLMSRVVVIRDYEYYQIVSERDRLKKHIGDIRTAVRKASA